MAFNIIVYLWCGSWMSHVNSVAGLDFIWWKVLRYICVYDSTFAQVKKIILVTLAVYGS